MLREWVFWGCLCALFVAYAGYPIGLAAVAAFARRPRPGAGFPAGELPLVTILVPARNEAHQIAEKVRDCLALDYPAARLEILVLDDGSTDGTGERARAAAQGCAPRFGVVRVEGRGGKAAALNAGAARAAGDILAFSDADCRVAPGALRLLVAHFADARVACAAGRYEPGHGGGGAYWRYEDFVRTRESALGGVLGASGALYAVRRSLFQPLPAGLINDDFVVPMRLRLAGYRTVYEPRARAWEVTSHGARPSDGEEMARRVRIMVGNCQHLALFCRLLPHARRRLGPTVQMCCHKFLRVASPAFLAGLAVASVALTAAGARGYGAALAGQVAFYALAWAGPRLAPGARGGLRALLTWPGYFVMLNGAAAAGVYRFAFRAGRVAWGTRGATAAGRRSASASRPQR